MHKALRELYDICDIENDLERTGWRKRRDSLDIWIKKWIQVIESEQAITDPKYFSAEYNDFLTEKLISNMMEETIENCAKRDIKRRKIEVEITLLRKIEKEI